MSSDELSNQVGDLKEGINRRDFLTTGAMGLGLLASYGTLAVMAGKFLYPAHPSPKVWVFVAEANKIKVGESFKYRIPTGQQITITRQGDMGTEKDFVALSSTCPHLGCQVHWEQQNNRFFCPCHNGIFDPSGKAIAGPPAEAGQSLLHYPIKIEKGLLYIKVPVEMAKATTVEVAYKSGHDPCLKHVIS